MPIKFSFRTQQVDYIELVSERMQSSFSDAFRKLIDRKIESAVDPKVPAKQVVKNLTVNIRHLAYIDRIAAQTGLSRSDVARRLVNEMLSRDVFVTTPKVSREFLREDEAA